MDAIKRFLGSVNGKVLVTFVTAVLAQPVVHDLIANAVVKNVVISVVVSAVLAVVHVYFPVSAKTEVTEAAPTAPKESA